MDGGGGGTRLVTRVEGIVCGRVNGPFLSEGNFFFFLLLERWTLMIQLTPRDTIV